LPRLEGGPWARELEDKVIRLGDPTRDLNCIVAVDSGFSEITYAGARLGLINVVGIEFKSRERRMHFSPAVLDKSMELSVEARAAEFEVATQLMESRRDCLVLLDGTIKLSTPSERYARAKSMLLSTARSSNATVLAHSKDVTINRYTELDIDERMPLFIAMEKNRAVDKYHGALATVPLILDELSIFYVQYRPHLLPIYVEAINPFDPSQLPIISKLVTGEGYPIPLYIVDRLSKLGNETIKYVKLSIAKLAKGYGALAIHETLREMLDRK